VKDEGSVTSQVGALLLAMARRFLRGDERSGNRGGKGKGKHVTKVASARELDAREKTKNGEEKKKKSTVGHSRFTINCNHRGKRAQASVLLNINPIANWCASIRT